MSLTELLITGAILGLGALLQGAVGFGLALVAVPLLVLRGHALPVAAALAVGATAVQTAYCTYLMRQHIVWRRALSFAWIRWMGVIAGVLCMGLLVDGDPAGIKRAVGMVVVLLVTVRVVWRPAPRESLARGWMVAAAGTGGFTAGMVGMGGPAIVLFALAHRWSPDTFRAFLWCQFLLGLPVVSAALTWRFGTYVLGWLALGVAMAPIVWASGRLGMILTQRWDSNRLHVAVVIVLYAIGISSIVGSF